MTRAHAPSRATWSSGGASRAWHRWLLGLAVGMAALSLVVIVLAVVDPREILGQNAWFKPLKFSLSITIYALTFAWLLQQVRRWPRVAHVMGVIIAIGLLVEIVIIVGAAAAGSTSHFNVSTPLNGVLWGVMAVSITVVWVASLIIGIAVAVSPGPDPARNLAVRAGVLLGLIGMGLAFLMTGPNEGQISDFRGVVGAHAVGVADGGPGLPFFGWSTEAGDLRVPHFIGMHGLQAIPLLLIVLEAASRRVRVLRRGEVRFRLVLIAAIGFGVGVAIVTGQALAGESVVHPSAPTMLGAASTAIGVVLAAVVVLMVGRRRDVASRGIAREPHASR